MLEFLATHFEHVLCVLILIGRIGDLGSTYLITPTLKLEMNPVIRKLRWKFALTSLALCLVPYYSTSLGVMVLVPSLLVSASNTAKIWMVRALGEDRHLEILYTAARSARLSHAIAGIWVSQTFLALVGLLLLFLSPDPERDWGFWIALGILIYAAVIAVYGSLFMVKTFAAAGRESPELKSPVQETVLPAVTAGE
jgi:hypothetical protein